MASRVVNPKIAIHLVTSLVAMICGCHGSSVLGHNPQPTPASTFAPATADIIEIQVPHSLAQLTPFEPSGLVREPHRSNFLVVGDDTGSKEDRTPLLFRMSAAGELDAAPVRIIGIRQLEDVESIAEKSDAIYVLSSQSRNRRGKRDRSRRAFVKLVPDGAGYRATLAISLFDALARETKAFRAGLGIDRLDDLEVEGMTESGGALFLGIKAPLDADGRALVWKLERPDELLAGVPAREAGLSVFARTELALGSKSKHHTGIADLTFIGSDLAILATLSRRGRVKGAVFRAPGAGGVVTSRLVRVFPGRRAEGVSVSLNDPTKLVVLFDNGAAPAEMTEIEWATP